jgi:Ras-related protein Rab-5C
MALVSKVVILGTASIGKTSIVASATTGSFDAEQAPTIGAAFSTKRLVVGQATVTLQIWDTAGQERFRALAPMYYHGAQVSLLVFDLTNESTLGEARRWAGELRQHIGSPEFVYLIGNKQDLPAQRAVSEDEGEAAADELKAVYFETSAVTGHNIAELFQDIAEHVVAADKSHGEQGPNETALAIAPPKARRRRTLC